ncbi:MAG: hypothetical protein ABI432_07055 [Flavobacteriales bacterium]
MRSSHLIGTLVGTLLVLSTQAMQVVLTPTHATCNYASGAIDVTVAGGEAPYNFLWNDASIEGDRMGLLPGIYSVTVTDALLDQVTEQVEILSVPYQFTTYQPYSYCNAGAQLFPVDPLPFPVPGPWFVNGEQLLPAPGYGGGGDSLWAFYPDQQYYNYPIVDVNGCSGTISGQTGEQVTSWPTLTVTGIDPSCTNWSTGAIHLLSSDVAPGGSWPLFLGLIGVNGLESGEVAYVDPGTHEAHFTGLGPGTYGIHWWLGVTLEYLDPGSCTYDTIWVTIPSLGNACGTLGGSSWYDVNGDCVHDANEVGIPYSPLQLQPSGEVILTNSDGGFHLPLLNGSYTLEQLDATLVPICPVVQPIPFTVNTDDTVLALANGSTQPLDLRASIATGTARPGFAMSVSASARNLGPQVSGPVTFTVQLDPAITYTTATPTPTSVAGGTVTWDLPAFNSYQVNMFQVTCQVPAGTALGTVLANTATVTNTLPDSDPTNDVDVVYTTVTGSLDPNEKLVSTSSNYSDSQYFIGTDAFLDYTIRFQNTGTDSAITVLVTDTLPATVDITSFQQGATSHACVVSFKPGRVVEWRFDNIMLPDSNVNEAESHGLTSFRIRPNEPVLPGEVIANNADIFFDFNTPVRTNDAVVTAEMSTAVGTAGQGRPGLRAAVVGEHLVLYAEGDGFAATSVRMLSMDGRVARSVGTTVIDRNGTALAIDGFSSGCYMLLVDGADGHTRSMRFVKP